MTNPESSFDWDDLLDCIEEKSVIPIIGQDLLHVVIDGKQQTMQQWLAYRLIEELNVPADSLASQNPSLNEVSLAFLDQAGDRQRRKIYTRIKSLLEEAQFPIPTALQQLASITDFTLFVNLGFDKLLEKAIDQARFNASQQTCSLAYATNTRIVDLPCELEKLPSPHVFHMFGLAGTTTEFAVTEEDQLELVYSLQDETRRPELLFDELSTNNLLFLGCELPDWLQRFLIRVLTNGRLRDTRDTAEFIADNQLRQNNALAYFLERYGTYNFLSGDPCEFVAKLQRRWSKRNPTQAIESLTVAKTAKLPKMESGAVFLSFSSVDRDKVRNIKNTLDQAGLDVWFDEQDLDYGINWDTEIQRNINQCSIFLPCISQNAAQVDKGVFRSEWKLAIKADQKMADSRRFIQPIVLDDCPEHINDIPAEFWDKQYTRLQGDTLPNDFVRQLVELMRKLQLKQAG